LECWKNESPNFNLNESFHYSITPPLHHSSRLPQGGKTIEAPSGGSPKQGPLDPDSLLMRLTILRNRLLLLGEQLDGIYNLVVNMIVADDLVDPILL